MALVKTNNGEIPKTLSDMMDQFFAEANLTKSTSFRPDMDLVENEKAYQVEVMLPGFQKSEIDVENAGQSLRISGSKNVDEEEERHKTYHLKESPNGNFERIIEIPEDGDLTKTEAEFDNGVLSITIPKHKSNNGKQIEIK